MYRKGEGWVSDVADLDGDGERDDCIGYLPFSIDVPMHPSPYVWDTEADNAMFYGGFTGFFLNQQKHGFTEMSTNVDHAWRDDINMMAHNGKDGYRAYGLWLWKKEDFRNGGAEYRVTFDDGSHLALHISRYWTGLDEGRWVVKDGERFYISEATFAGCNKGKGKTHVVVPTRTNWAAYAPQEKSVVFDKAKAKFAPHLFQNIQAVGYYICKDTFSKSGTGVKLDAFEVTATVHRPVRPSETLSMVKIKGGLESGVPPFFMSTTEVPYAVWHDVYRWATSNMYAISPRHIMDKDGDAGSTDFQAHTHCGRACYRHHLARCGSLV